MTISSHAPGLDPGEGSVLRVETTINDAGAVNNGRRPPPKAARSVIDGPEHGGRIAPDGSETKKTVAHSDPLRPGAEREMCGTG